MGQYKEQIFFKFKKKKEVNHQQSITTVIFRSPFRADSKYRNVYRQMQHMKHKYFYEMPGFH